MPDINMQVFGEAQRNQLVTEVDIQTQVALDDYQVQLSDIANPTQSQDNVVIDRFGEFLPHWNETLDFDTWVKMSMETAGKRIMMLRGNSNVSSASDGVATFFGGAFGEFAVDEDWNWRDASVDESFGNASGTLRSNANQIDAVGINRSAQTYAWKDIGAGEITDFKIIFKSKLGTSTSAAAGTVYCGISDTLGHMQAGNSLGVAIGYHNPPGNQQVAIAHFTTTTYDGSANINLGAGSYNTDYWFVFERIGTSVTLDMFSDAALNNSVGSASYTDSSPVAFRYVFPIVASGYSSGHYYYGYVDDFRMRKSTTIEPTWVADTPQNIVTALQSLGRVG